MARQNLSERRAEALALYDEASANPDSANWQAVADALAAVTPRPKKAEPSKFNVATGLEWEAYTPAMRRQRGYQYRSARAAKFRFADGVIVRAPLRHHSKRERPDWERASRMAVHFWRTNAATAVRRLAKLETWGEAERYAKGLEVPPIIGATDETRGSTVDPGQANETTAELRRGNSKFLADVMDVAADLGGDWEQAARRILVAPNPYPDVPDWIADKANYRANVAAWDAARVAAE